MFRDFHSRLLVLVLGLFSFAVIGCANMVDDSDSSSSDFPIKGIQVTYNFYYYGDTGYTGQYGYNFDNQAIDWFYNNYSVTRLTGDVTMKVFQLTGEQVESVDIENYVIIGCTTYLDYNNYGFSSRQFSSYIKTFAIAKTKNRVIALVGEKSNYSDSLQFSYYGMCNSYSEAKTWIMNTPAFTGLSTVGFQTSNIWLNGIRLY